MSGVLQEGWQQPLCYMMRIVAKSAACRQKLRDVVTRTGTVFVSFSFFWLWIGPVPRSDFASQCERGPAELPPGFCRQGLGFHIAVNPSTNCPAAQRLPGLGAAVCRSVLDRQSLSAKKVKGLVCCYQVLLGWLFRQVRRLTSSRNPKLKDLCPWSEVKARAQSTSTPPLHLLSPRAALARAFSRLPARWRAWGFQACRALGWHMIRPRSLTLYLWQIRP